MSSAQKTPVASAKRNIVAERNTEEAAASTTTPHRHAKELIKEIVGHKAEPVEALTNDRNLVRRYPRSRCGALSLIGRTTPLRESHVEYLRSGHVLDLQLRKPTRDHSLPRSRV
jgi:hypothetical protein